MAPGLFLDRHAKRSLMRIRAFDRNGYVTGGRWTGLGCRALDLRHIAVSLALEKRDHVIAHAESLRESISTMNER